MLTHREDLEKEMGTKASPLQRVRDEHGSKEELAKKVIGILEKGEDEEQDAFEHRVNTMSNRKLLRLWQSNATLNDKWGSKDALAQAITKARFPGGNTDYQTKISGYSIGRLIDLARQHKV